MTAARRDLVLYLVALLLACACVAGGVLVLRERGDRQDAAARADRYGEVIEAAEATALAMVNIERDDPQASIDAVAATATGTFLEQYQSSAASLVELVDLFEATLTSTVSSSAVSTLDSDSASVLVATEGEVSNSATGGEVSARYFRFLIKLVRQDGVWLANELEIVG